MIRWFARNDIAANFLLVAILLGGGWAALFKVPLEVRPAYVFNYISVSMSYRGATPEDVETTIAIPIERALEGMGGLQQMDVSVGSGSARFRIYADEDANLKEMLEEVQRRIDSITTFPAESERPEVSIPSTDQWWEVASVIISGDVGESELVRASHQIRDELLALPDVSQIQLRGNRDREISIEADPEVLRGYRLNLQDLSTAIRNSSIDLPAGAIRAASGRILLRTRSQAYDAEAYEDIILSAADGAEVRLGEVAKVTDGFEEGKQLMRFNGVPCLRIEVMRTGKENAIKISDAVNEYIDKANTRLPSGLSLAMWDDESISLRGRLSTLAWSLAQGGFLVLLLLGLFLRPMLAFWVVVGIPVSFAGGLLLMPYFGITLNMMSLFAFIIVLGIVVDDAIVTGENIYSKLREGMTPLEGAVLGTKEVATPVTFGVITTIVAFIPLSFYDGFWGTYTRQIPPIVGAVLIFSLIESKLVLPAHLKHLKTHRRKLGPVAKFQKSVADGLERFVERVYQPSLAIAVKHRYICLTGFIALGALCWGVWKGGHLGFEPMPSIDRYQISANIKMAEDTPFERTDEVVLQIAEAAKVLGQEFTDPENGLSFVTKILTGTGTSWRGSGADEERGMVSLEILTPSERSASVRGIRNDVLEKRWRELIGEIEDARTVHIRSEQGGGHFSEIEAIEVELRGPDSDRKREIAEEIELLFEARKGEIAGAWNDVGKRRNEFEITLKPRAGEFGLTERDLAQQIRGSFFGAEAQRIQRDREEIRVMVRMPEKRRDNLHTLESLRINTGNNGPPVPFSHVAELTLVKAPSGIERIDGARVSTVAAQPVDRKVDIIGIAKTTAPMIDALVGPEPGLSWRYQGFVAEHEASNKQTVFSIIALVVALYALLAIPFRSLSQPIFVLLAIPFGVIGALLGHLLLGEVPSYLSIFGMLALAGVVVNDSLVMVDFTNQRVRNGANLKEAILASGASRFRPILLTSLTTFFGLLPLILDDSIQAKFLIPMAISLAFGILFATAITLYLIPCAYVANEDIKRQLGRVWRWYTTPFMADPQPELETEE